MVYLQSKACLCSYFSMIDDSWCCTPVDVGGTYWPSRDVSSRASRPLTIILVGIRVRPAAAATTTTATPSIVGVRVSICSPRLRG